MIGATFYYLRYVEINKIKAFCKNEYHDDIELRRK
jgi:hypothetical protein